VSEALQSALVAARSRLASGLAKAEADLSEARERAGVLRRSLAVAKSRLEAEVIGPTASSVAVGEAGPLPVAAPSAGAAARAPAATLAQASVGAPKTQPPPPPPQPAVEAPPMPLSWRAGLERLRRGSPDGIARRLSPNVVVRWDGRNPVAGTRLGTKQAIPRIRLICGHIDPAALLVEAVVEEDGGLSVTAQITLVSASLPDLRLQTRVTAAIRFDETGRIGMLWITPHDGVAVDTFFMLGAEKEPRA
jgi:hypothetical protein